MKISISNCRLAFVLATASMFSAPLVGQTVLYRTTPYNLPPYNSCDSGRVVVAQAQVSPASTLPYDGRIVLGTQETRVLRQASLLSFPCASYQR